MPDQLSAYGYLCLCVFSKLIKKFVQLVTQLINCGIDDFCPLELMFQENQAGAQLH